MPRHLGDFSLRHDLYEELRQEAARRGESMSFIVREALRAYLPSLQGQQTAPSADQREDR